MTSQKETDQIRGTEKEFTDRFRQLTYSRSGWEVWSDLMTVMACSIHNSVYKEVPDYEKKETEYEQAINRLGGVQLPGEIFTIVVEALENNPDQDFLGKLYMTLELSSHWKGQFFTPYTICQLMAKMTIKDKAAEKIEQHGYISVNDPACGAGATLIAAANKFKEEGINYQQRVLFIGQDIDRVVAQMCYIQLSLLGCPGYVVVANTITQPLIGDAIDPFPQEGQEFWYTPFYAMKIWEGRRLCHLMDKLMRPQKPHYTFYFDFEKEDYYARTDDGRRYEPTCIS